MAFCDCAAMMASAPTPTRLKELIRLLNMHAIPSKDDVAKEFVDKFGPDVVVRPPARNGRRPKRMHQKE